MLGWQPTGHRAVSPAAEDASRQASRLDLTATRANRRSIGPLGRADGPPSDPGRAVRPATELRRKALPFGGPRLRGLADRSGRRRYEGDQTEASPRFSHAVLMGRSAYRRTS